MSCFVMYYIILLIGARIMWFPSTNITCSSVVQLVQYGPAYSSTNIFQHEKSVSPTKTLFRLTDNIQLFSRNPWLFTYNSNHFVPCEPLLRSVYYSIFKIHLEQIEISVGTMKVKKSGNNFGRASDIVHTFD